MDDKLSDREERVRIDDGRVFRSAIDDRVWMCNIPDTDVATGLQASTSLRKVKAYVERTVGFPGRWSRLPLSKDWVFVGDD